MTRLPLDGQDSTPLRVGRSRRQQLQNGRAWLRYAGQDMRCPYCRHDHTCHLVNSERPFVRRLANTPDELDAAKMVRLEDGATALAVKEYLSGRAEVESAFCRRCARDLSTAQVQCYQAAIGVGEVVGRGLRVRRPDETEVLVGRGLGDKLHRNPIA